MGGTIYTPKRQAVQFGNHTFKRWKYHYGSSCRGWHSHNHQGQAFKVGRMRLLRDVGSPLPSNLQPETLHGVSIRWIYDYCGYPYSPGVGNGAERRAEMVKTRQYCWPLTLISGKDYITALTALLRQFLSARTPQPTSVPLLFGLKTKPTAYCILWWWYFIRHMKSAREINSTGTWSANLHMTEGSVAMPMPRREWKSETVKLYQLRTLIFFRHSGLPCCRLLTGNREFRCNQFTVSYDPVRSKRYKHPSRIWFSLSPYGEISKWLILAETRTKN